MHPQKKKKIRKNDDYYDAEELADLGIFIDHDKENIEDE